MEGGGLRVVFGVFRSLGLGIDRRSLGILRS